MPLCLEMSKTKQTKVNFQRKFIYSLHINVIRHHVSIRAEILLYPTFLGVRIVEANSVIKLTTKFLIVRIAGYIAVDLRHSLALSNFLHDCTSEPLSTHHA